MRQFYGKYRGTVVNNVDPLRLGRVQVQVPAVYGDGTLSWAMPCVPYAGRDVGLFTIPPVGSLVWVEFEGGHLDYPIWSGCFWAEGQVPASPAIPEIKILKTPAGTIKISDQPGAAGITLETATGMKIVLDASGIELNNGHGATIKLSGSQVNVNNGALEVM